jgi:uncharacterized protein YndB with AHSA1/START domain
VPTKKRVGSSIVWKGEWQGKPYNDQGNILKSERERFLQYSHFSPLSGKTDVPEHYRTVTIELEEKGSQTLITLSQDHNETEDDQEHSQTNWQMMLDKLRTFLEKQQEESPAKETLCVIIG